ncbi:MAG TPA: OsmC family protein [Gemmatimonadaceae bacterium]|nr:OsmC family protein [Gemmatimonadaceae bacterium]
MKILLLSEERIRLEGTPGPLTIEADRPDAQYSPFHMLASSLATCVLSVLASWAEHAKLDASGLALEVDWRFAEKPHRVGTIDVKIIWPQLPPERRTAAERAAHLCAIHNTLANAPTVTTEIAS